MGGEGVGGGGRTRAVLAQNVLPRGPGPSFVHHEDRCGSGGGWGYMGGWGKAREETCLQGPRGGGSGLVAESK
jgi:hypothetical protein